MSDPWADFRIAPTPPDPWAAFRQPQAPVPSTDGAPSPAPGIVAGSLKGAARALEGNLPFVDRAVAGAQSVLPQGYGGTGQDYATNLSAERAKNQQFATDNPVTNFVGGATAYAPAALIGGGATLPARIGSSALASFGLGGLQGASNSPDLTNSQETGRSIAQGELTGGALGAFFPAAGHAIGRGVSGLATALRGGPGEADLAALQTAKQAAYQNVKDMGAAYSPEAFSSLVNKIASDAKEQNINPGLHPGASSVIADMQARAKQGTPVTLPELDQMRQIAWRDSGGKPDAAERFFGGGIRKNIDDFVNTAFPGDMAPMPGAAKPTAVAPAEPAFSRPQVPPGPAPQPMLDFLRRLGGLQDEGGDLRSMGFSNLKGVAGKGSYKIIDKENGRPMDEGLRAAIEGGFMEPHETVADFINKIGEHPTYSVHDEEAVGRRAERDAYDFGQGESEPRDWDERERIESGRVGVGDIPGAAQNGNGLGSSLTPPIPSGPVASAQGAADAIQNARDLAQRQFKTQALAEALNKAEIQAAKQGIGGNTENAARQRLAPLLDKESWSPDEFAQLNQMVRGTRLTNALREASRLSPFQNTLMKVAEGTSFFGAPTMTTLAATLGSGAHLAGNIARRNAQNRLMETILAGGKTPTPPPMSAISGNYPRAALAATLAGNQNLQTQRRQNLSQ
jgi:hypothetical protein